MREADIIKTFFDTVWNGGDAEAVYEYFAPGANATGLVGGMALDAEDMIAFVQTLSMHVKNIEVEVVHVLVDGDWVSGLVRSTGTCRRSGRAMTLSGQTLVRLQDGLIAEAYNHFDLLGFFVQLNLLPPDAIERLLAGMKAA